MTALKRSQAEPTELMSTLGARHVIATTILLYCFAAIGASLTVFLNPFDRLTRRRTNVTRMRIVATVETILARTLTCYCSAAHVALFNHANDAAFTVECCLDATLDRHCFIERVLLATYLVE